MRNKRFIIALAGAVVFGLIATVAVTRYLANAQAYTKNLGNVVVAKFPIPLGTKITAELLGTTPIPRGSTPEGAFDSTDNVIGRVAITNIGVREPITSSKLAVEGSAGGLSAVIPEGYRAMTVKVDDVVGISGFVMPGSFVDIVAVIEPADRTSNNNPISKIVLQNIKVLANGKNIDLKDGREATNVKAVTLQVTPGQAEKLALATNEGKLQLVMRNYGDQDDADTRGADKESLLSGESFTMRTSSKKSEVQPTPQPQPAPAVRPRQKLAMPRMEKPPPVAVVDVVQPVYPNKSVEMIEGAKKRTVDFP
ncbi:MAG: Flp pilus assembly protein CpaB [Acidobacteriota bacterium]|nr:Flp pilus assembly protein CpaB [Acidobacteriota bacterium]